MSPRRQSSPLDDMFAILKVVPFWVGPILAAIVYVFFRFLLPALLTPKHSGFDPGAILRQLSSSLSWLPAVAILGAWVAAEIWKLFNRRLVDSQTGLASIRDVSWQAFERLVSEAYRRKGYMAEIVGSASGDGGVDIRLTGHGETVLVQCKQWKAYKVGVTTVRELLGVVVHQKADRGIVVTSGRFTQEARDFARQSAQIELVGGPELAELIQGVQVAPPQTPTPRSASKAPNCPLCGAEMVLRTARRGQNAGTQFWGCSKYPGCRGIRQVEGVREGARA